MGGVTVTALAARPVGDVPRVRGTAVTVLTDHVGLAGTLTGLLITLTLARGRTGLGERPRAVAHALCTEDVTDQYLLMGHVHSVGLWCDTGLTPAALRGSVAVVTQFAVLASVAVGVVQAFEAGPRPGVAGPRVVHVDVAVALAGHAAPPGHQGVTVVTGGALVTSGAWFGKKTR